MDAPSREEALASIASVTSEIATTRTRLTELYQRRGDLFLATIEEDPDCPVKAMADAAGGITGPAVSQQIEKAQARRKAAGAETVATAGATA